MQFHETKMGMDHYLKNFPKLIKAAERIADALEKQNNTVSSGIGQSYCCKMDSAKFANVIKSVSMERIVTVTDENNIVFLDSQTNTCLPLSDVAVFAEIAIKNICECNSQPVIEAIINKNNTVYVIFHY